MRRLIFIRFQYEDSIDALARLLHARARIAFEPDSRPFLVDVVEHLDAKQSKALRAKGSACVVTRSADPDVSGNVVVVPHDAPPINDYVVLCRLEQPHPAVVGITGSVGKTTTKELVSCVLAERWPVCKSKRSYNAKGSLARMVAKAHPGDAIVAELGADKKGDIESMSQLLRPDIAVITAIARAHLQGFDSLEGVLAAKLEIVQYARHVLINGDDPLLSAIPGAVLVAIDNEAAPYRAENIELDVDRFRFDAITPRGRIADVEVRLAGRNNVRNALFACAVGVMNGLSDYEIRHGLRMMRPCGDRLHWRSLQGIDILSDWANACPEAVASALDVLAERAQAQNRRSVAVLGDMKELGAYSEDLHGEVGRMAAERGIDLLICIGEFAASTADAARIAGMREVVALAAGSEGCREMVSLVQQDDVVLIKGSSACFMDRYAHALYQRWGEPA